MLYLDLFLYLFVVTRCVGSILASLSSSHAHKKPFVVVVVVGAVVVVVVGAVVGAGGLISNAFGIFHPIFCLG